MTEDQTRSYRNSLRGTNYGQSVYRGGGLAKVDGEYEDDDNIFDNSSGSSSSDSGNEVSSE